MTTATYSDHEENPRKEDYESTGTYTTEEVEQSDGSNDVLDSEARWRRIPWLAGMAIPVRINTKEEEKAEFLRRIKKILGH